MKWAGSVFRISRCSFCLNGGVGHRLLPEKTVSSRDRSGRGVIIGNSPIFEGVNIRSGCQFIGSLFRSLARLPGGLPRFIPGSIGPHLSRLRQFGWLQCDHGLTCRPFQSSLPGCIEPALDLLGYPAGSVAHLANGALKVRFCNTPFVSRLPFWVLGSGVDTHQVMNSRLKMTVFPPVSFSPPGTDSGGITHPVQDVRAGYLPLPGGVEDAPRGIRRRLNRTTSPHVLGLREASRLRSEGNGRPFLGPFWVTRKSTISLELEWAR